MVKYIIQTCQDQIVGFQVNGHAGYEDDGRDIVCAGVSAIAQTAALGLVNQCEKEVHWMQDKGRLVCQVGKLDTAEKIIAAQAILKSMQLGIEALREAYPKFVKVEYKEVQPNV